MAEATRFGVLVRGGDVDEAPQVYRPLPPVLEARAGSLAVGARLRPVGVVRRGRAGSVPGLNPTPRPGPVLTAPRPSP